MSRFSKPDYDTGFMTFPEYAENYLLEGLNSLVYASLTMPTDQGGYGLPAEQANALTPMIVAAFAAHYAGNESPDAETLAAIEGMLASDDRVTKSLGQSLYALWTDSTPDIHVVLNPVTGALDPIARIACIDDAARFPASPACWPAFGNHRALLILLFGTRMAVI